MKTQTMNTRANQLSALQATVLTQVLSALGSYAQQKKHLSSDSRKIESGDAFVAYPFDPLSPNSDKHDGRTYVDAAVQNGAGAVLWQEGKTMPPLTIPARVVPQLNILAGHIAHSYYGKPSDTMRMIAITGTNGKTSSAQWLAQILAKHHLPCGIMGTLGVGFPDAMQETGFTTPPAIEVHRYLADMRTQGAKAMAMEVSSHALEQGRVNGVAYEIALFTNLSRDHLDYHGDMASYEAAKARLFTWSTLKTAVINTDDEAGLRYAQIAEQCGVTVIGYGLNPQPNGVKHYLQASEIDQSGALTQFTLNVDGMTHRVRSRLVGEFNVMNTLGVLGVCMGLGLNVAECVADCADIAAAPGRMQRFGGDGQPLVVVDFAHTPDALEKTLTALLPIAHQRGGQLTCVFGCGGDRDPGKRPQMGAIAQKIADRVVVTSDNPRTEDPDQIVRDILAGMTQNEQVRAEVHRPSAINRTVEQAAVSDVILIAGKGHEPYQDVQGVKHPYSDLVQAEQALALWQTMATNQTVSETTDNNDIAVTSEGSAEDTMGSCEINGQTVSFKRVSIDTRTMQPTDLLIALKGERFDAHDFLPKLQPGQVAAVLAERVPEGFAIPHIVVDNTHQALQDLAKSWRSQFDVPVAVVTGSNGKTTVKEMLSAIMRAAFDDAYLATRGNLNNDIGLPLTLLEMKKTHRAAVIELGMNHPGETAQLAPVVAPTVAVINNAQREHQEFMQTVEAVAYEHADVIDSVTDGGAVVFPADDTYAAIWRERAQARGVATHEFSLNPAAHAAYSARYELGLYASTVQLITPMGQCTTQINIPGVHNVHNALAACAAATAMGVPLDAVAKGLANFVPAKGRLQTHRLPALGESVILIDDTYNANPDSVLAAIDVLANAAGRKILVLGDMGEVGDDGDAFHAEIGAHAAQCGVNVLLATGEMMRQATQAFGVGAQHFNDVSATADVVRAHIQSGANTILVKGSRFMGMERVVDALLEMNQAQAAQASGVPETTEQ